MNPEKSITVFSKILSSTNVFSIDNNNNNNNSLLMAYHHDTEDRSKDTENAVFQSQELIAF